MILNPDLAICRDYIDAEVFIKNIGQRDDDVIISLENTELELALETEEFELEKYDDDNEASRMFSFKIPDNAKAGSYNIKGKVLYDNGDEENFMIKTLVLEECKEQEQKTEKTETISLGEKKEEAKKVEIKDNRKIILFVSIAVLTIIILLWLIYLLSLIA